MQITKKHNNSNRIKTISFIHLISELELTGIKQNRASVNYRLLNNECIKYNDYTYFRKIGG